MNTSPILPPDPALAQLLHELPTRAQLSNQPEMDAEEVARILQLAEIAGIPIVVDGGWAVDALLGWQTRPHSDLDLAINQQYLPRFLNILKRLDYQYAPTDDAWEHNFVLEDGAGHRIDLHSFVRNNVGQIIAGVEYPGDSLTGQGKIAGTPLSCIHPEWLIDFHLGYAFDHNDYQDVNYLCNLYKLPLPAEYRDYANALYDGKTISTWQPPDRFQSCLPQNESEYIDLLNLLDKTQLERLPAETMVRFQEMLSQAGQARPALNHFAQANLRLGMLLMESNRPIGALELAKSPESDPDGQSQIWEIRQLTLKERSNYASLFMLLVRSGLQVIQEACLPAKTGEALVYVSPLDDINQPRPALPERYDLGDIGFSSFYARVGFKRAEANPASRWVINLKV